MHQAAFNRSLAELGVKDHGFDLNAFPHHTDSYISKEIFERSTGKTFKNELKKQFEETLWNDIKEKSIQEVNGASAFVNRLHSEGQIKFCFASGALRRTAIFKLKEIVVPFHEELVVASDEHHSREEILKNAISNTQKRYRIDKFDQIYSIGDGIWDLKTAQNLGLEFIGIGTQHKQLMQEHGMAHHFDDFDSDVQIIDLVLAQ